MSEIIGKFCEVDRKELLTQSLLLLLSILNCFHLPAGRHVENDWKRIFTFETFQKILFKGPGQNPQPVTCQTAMNALTLIPLLPLYCIFCSKKQSTISGGEVNLNSFLDNDWRNE